MQCLWVYCLHKIQPKTKEHNREQPRPSKTEFLFFFLGAYWEKKSNQFKEGPHGIGTALECKNDAGVCKHSLSLYLMLCFVCGRGERVCVLCVSVLCVRCLAQCVACVCVWCGEVFAGKQRCVSRKRLHHMVVLNVQTVCGKTGSKVYVHV